MIPLYNKDELADIYQSYWNDPDPNEYDLDLIKEGALLPDVKLQQHQKTVLDRFKDSERGRMLLFHSVGSGKGLSAIGVAEQLGQPYTAIVPASLRPNMIGEINRFTDKATPSDVMSYNSVVSDKPVPKTNTLIFDEIQRAKNFNSQLSIKSRELASKAKRLILASGTPITNSVEDFAAPMSMLLNKEITPDQFRDRYIESKEVKPNWYQRLKGVTPGVEEEIKNKAELEALLAGHIDYYKPEQTTVPVTRNHFDVEMSPDQSQLYKAMFGKLPWMLRYKLKFNYPLNNNELQNLTSLLSGPRSVSLSPYSFMRNKDPYAAFQKSTKLQKAFELMQEKLKDGKSKAIAYSNLVQSGLVPYKAALDKAGIPSGIFHGSLSDSARRKLVNDFNTGALRVALLAPAGSEGISLKGVRLSQILDPHWHNARSRQAEARGLRFGSHDELPEAERDMEIQTFASRLPLGYRQQLFHNLLGKDYSDETRASDNYLMTLGEKKDKQNQKFVDLLKEIGSRHNEKVADDAKGIPSREDFGDLSKLEMNKLYDYVRQQHHVRSGLHEDIRLGNPELGMYSWAARKGLPTFGKKHLAVQQPIHAHSYNTFEGQIPKGQYGAGTVTTADKGEVLVTSVNEQGIDFTLAHRGNPERFKLIKPRDNTKNWLLLNTSPTQPVPYNKQRYKTIQPDQVENALKSLSSGSVSPKYDGAATLSKLMHKHHEILSYRVAKNTGYPITYTEKVHHGRPEVNIPPDLRGTVLRGELLGIDGKGKSIPPTSLGGILNSSVGKALRTQEEKNIQLKNIIFDIQQLGKKPITNQTPYNERMEMIKDVLSRANLGDKYMLPEQAHTPEDALKLWEQIKSNKHPLTNEGVVIHPVTGPPLKAKLRQDYDVYIRNVFPGLGKYKDNGAGGFEYSHDQNGAIVGKVGTGLSDEIRRDMFANPDAYIGRVAKVKAHEQHPSGALRAPAFISLHEDYPTKYSSVIEGLEIKPRSSIHVGEGSNLTPESIESLLQHVEKNTGNRLGNVPILANKEQFWRNIGRYYLPRTLKQVPERVGRILETIATPLVPGIGINAINNAIENARMPKGDFYLPDIGTVNVGKGHPVTLTHELGHYVDHELNKGPFRHGWLKSYKEQLTPTLNSELNASLFARKALGDQYTPEAEQRLSTALGSYLYAEQDNINQRSIKEWWRDIKTRKDKNWKKNLQVGLESNDDIERRRVVRNALSHVLRHKEDLGTDYPIPIDEIKGNLVWTDKKTRGVVDLAKALLNHEYQRKYKEASVIADSVGSPLQQLLSAKAESDRRNYNEKHRILRHLMQTYPNDFIIDSEQGDIIGITHNKTGFRIHMPKKYLPMQTVKPMEMLNATI